MFLLRVISPFQQRAFRMGRFATFAYSQFSAILSHRP